MSIQFYNGVILFVNGQMAMDPACCCQGCSFTIRVTLNWGNVADLDVYGSVDGAWPTYYGNPWYNGLTLSVDAHPVCWGEPSPPEVISGDFTDGHTFRFWYDQYSDCEQQTAPAVTLIEVINNGSSDICVNGTTVWPGETWQADSLACAGYATWGSPGFQDGTIVEVACGECD